jgi:hypothetical protein
MNWTQTLMLLVSMAMFVGLGPMFRGLDDSYEKNGGMKNWVARTTLVFYVFVMFATVITFVVPFL